MMKTIEFEIASYFILGGLFMCYFLIVFTQWKINNTLRLSLSGIFLFIGFALMSLAGKLLYGETISYTLMALGSCFITAILSAILVYYLYERNKKIRRYSEKKNM